MELDRIKEFANKLILDVNNKGIKEADACFMNESNMGINILNKEVSTFEESTEQGLSLRVKINDQIGIAHTTNIDDSSISFLVDSAIENAKIKNDTDSDYFYCDEDNKELSYFGASENANKNTYDNFANLGLSLETAILNSDSRIKAVDYLSVSSSKNTCITVNTLGLNSIREQDYISVVAEARCEADGVVKTGMYFWLGTDIDKFNQEEFVNEVRQRTVSKLGATSIKSGVYDVILSQESFIALFSKCISNFYAYHIQKGISLLNDKVNTKIASDIFTLKELPNYEKAIIKIPFDSEGVVTKDKSIIENGIFKTAFYSVKTATKEGITPTGNGYRGSYSSEVSESFSNLVVEPGNFTFDELCNKAGNGIYITDIIGLHAGLNTISGDFSLSCEGFLIENGKVTRPLELITIADNFYNFIKKIDAVGNDEISYPAGEGQFFSPSILISKVNIAGEKSE